MLHRETNNTEIKSLLQTYQIHGLLDFKLKIGMTYNFFIYFCFLFVYTLIHQL